MVYINSRNSMSNSYLQLLLTYIGIYNLILTLPAYIIYYPLFSYYLKPVIDYTSLLTYRPALGQFTLPIIDIKLLIKPPGSNSLISKKSSVSIASISTGVIIVYIIILLEYISPPAYITTLLDYSLIPTYLAH